MSIALNQIIILATLDANTEALKNELLFLSEKTRDLDLCQGQYKGQHIYERLFNAIEGEVKHRAKEMEKKRREPDLPFSEDAATYKRRRDEFQVVGQ